MVALGGGAVSYERGTPVEAVSWFGFGWRVPKSFPKLALSLRRVLSLPNNVNKPRGTETFSGVSRS